MVQGDLFFVKNSDTSRKAAESISKRTPTLRALVLEALRKRGPMTDEELQISLHMNPSTERPRRIELMKEHLICEDGTRKTRSGRMAVVWKAVA